MNDDDLQRRLARLQPAELPDDLRRRLHAAEPTPLPSWLHGWQLGFRRTCLRPWPLAYAGLGGAWVLILTLHLLTQPSRPLAPEDRPAVTQFSDRVPDTSLLLPGGFAVDRASLLTRNHLDTPLP